MRHVPVPHPAGALRASKSSPGRFVAAGRATDRGRARSSRIPDVTRIFHAWITVKVRRLTAADIASIPQNAIRVSKG